MNESWNTLYHKNNKRESPKAFQLFQQYITMGNERSLKKLHEQNPETSYKVILQYSSKYKWNKRIQDKINEDTRKLQKTQEEQANTYFDTRLTQVKEHNEKLNKILLDTFQVIEKKMDSILRPKTYEKLTPEQKTQLNKIKLTSLLLSLDDNTNAMHLNDKMALRILGLPETIRDKEETNETTEIPEYLTPEQNKKQLQKLLTEGSHKIKRKDTYPLKE